MFRRSTRGHARISGGVSPSASLLSFGDGTFTRSTEGSYQTGANSLAWAGANVLRLENRGDGNGAVALFEGASENQAPNPEALWANWAFSNATLVSQTFTAPDGEADASRWTWDLDTSGSLAEDNTAVGTDDATIVFSTWAKFASPESVDEDTRLRWRNKAGAADNLALISGGSSEWNRYTEDGTMGTGVSTPRFQAFNVATGGTDKDVSLWGLQVEELPFASSYIRSGSARGVDALSFSDVPDAMKTGRFEFDVYPLFAQNEYASQAYMMAWRGTTNQNDGVYFENQRIYVISGGALTNLGLVSYSRDQKITISFDLSVPEVTLSGLTSGNGTTSISSAFDSTLTSFHVGTDRANNKPLYGRISEPRAW